MAKDKLQATSTTKPTDLIVEAAKDPPVDEVRTTAPDLELESLRAEIAQLRSQLDAAAPATAEVKTLGGVETDWEVSVPGTHLAKAVVKTCHASQAIEAYKQKFGIHSLPAGASAVPVPPTQE